MKTCIPFVLILLSVSLQAWSQTGPYKVYALKFASAGSRMPISDWADKGPKNDSVDIDFMVWLIKGNGKNILVDAGFLNDIPDAKEFAVTRYTRPDSVLARLDLKPTVITDIILSHPHWDHIDGLGLFPNAQVWMQLTDYVYYVALAWQKGAFNGGFNKRDVRMLLDINLAGRLMLVDGDDKEIIPGIKVYTGSQHTFNSQYAVVETGKNKVLLASDNIWIYYILDHMVPPAPGGTFDPKAYVQAMVRMKTLVTNKKYIIPGHDAKIFSLFPAVADGVVQIQ